jgi:hypothetical protein
VWFGISFRYATPLTFNATVECRGSSSTASGSCALASTVGISAAERAPVAIAPPFRNARRETESSGLSRSSLATVHPLRAIYDSVATRARGPKPARRELTTHGSEGIALPPLNLPGVLSAGRQIEGLEKDGVHLVCQPQVDVLGWRRHLDLIERQRPQERPVASSLASDLSEGFTGSQGAWVHP